jgi:RNA polymerase sigma-70 factor (ECF subfamily)
MTELERAVATSIAARRGPVEAVVLEAWQAHQRALYAFARTLGRDAGDAEDLVADAFLKLTREVTAGRTPDQIRAWLFRVVANDAVNRSRRRSVAQRVLVRLIRSGIEEPADAPLLRSESSAAVVAALRTLPVASRTALLLAAQGFSGREVAAAIGRSESATRTLLSRGRVRLRAEIERSGGES